MKILIRILKKKIAEGEMTIFRELENNLKFHKKILFIASRIYEIITKSSFLNNDNDVKQWRKLISSVISMCKLNEDVFKAKLPSLEAKCNTVLKDVFGIILNNFRISEKIAEVFYSGN